MQADMFRLGSIFFFVLGVSIHLYVRPIIFSAGGGEIIFHFFFFLLAAILFFLSFKDEKTEAEIYICQSCNIELKRDQIKFGLCPKCGTKIKDFKGMQSFFT